MSSALVTAAEVNAFLAAELPSCVEMGITCDTLEPDVAIARFAYSDRFSRPGGYVMGGTLMALADAAVYMAIFTRAGIVPMAVTNELKMNFLRPAVGRCDVLARASLLKMGRRVAFASVDLAEEPSPARLVAHATASYLMPES